MISIIDWYLVAIFVQHLKSNSAFRLKQELATNRSLSRSFMSLSAFSPKNTFLIRVLPRPVKNIPLFGLGQDTV